MRNYGQLIACAVLISVFMVSAAIVVAGQEQPGNPAYAWLNGKWVGQTARGDELEMELKVINDNQVRGSGRIALGGARRGTVTVTGTAHGPKVILEVYQPEVQETARYLLGFTDGTLSGIIPGKGVRTTFRKIE